MTDTNSTSQDLLEAMASLDQDLPTQAAAKAEAGVKAPSFADLPEGIMSPTLSHLEEFRRPQETTVCERCPNSVWFSSPDEVKCYCRVMYLVTWSSQEPNQLTSCDGFFLDKE